MAYRLELSDLPPRYRAQAEAQLAGRGKKRGDTVTVALPGGGTGVQLQVNLSTNDDKVTPALRHEPQEPSLV